MNEVLPRRAAGARGERGSVLLLVPAAVLVLIILGAIAVDSAIAFLGQRELSNLAAAVANDAATAALSDPRFYRGDPTGEVGSIEIDTGAAQRLADRAVELGRPRGVRNIEVDVTVDNLSAGRQVCVVLRGEVDYVFARAVPGAAHRTTVESRAVATAVEDGRPATGVPNRAIC